MRQQNKLWKLLPYYKKYLKLIIITIILSFLYAGLSLLVPIFSGNLLASFSNFNSTTIIKIAIYLVVLRLFIEIVSKIWSTIILKLNNNVDFELKHNMMNSLIQLQVKNFDYTHSGIFIARINKDSSDLSVLFDVITDDLAQILLNVGFVIYSFFLNIYLGIFLILNIIILYIVISKKMVYFKRYRKDYKQKDEKVVGTYGDIIRGIRDIKNLNLKKQQ